VLEALACDVPVLATPVGVHPAALDGVAGTLCAPFDRAAWQAVVQQHVQASDPRIAGRDRAALWSARQMARRVLEAWGEVLRLPVEAPKSGAVSA
jgi:teichuronic acid biosynthesis glycosyltransferase TuaC